MSDELRDLIAHLIDPILFDSYGNRNVTIAPRQVALRTERANQTALNIIFMLKEKGYLAHRVNRERVS